MGGCCASKPQEDAGEEAPAASGAAAAAAAAPPAAEPNTGDGGDAAAAAGAGGAAPEGRTPDSGGGVTVKVVRDNPTAGLGMQFEGVLDEATGAGHLLVGAVSPKKVAGQHGLQDFTGQCLTHVNDAPIRDVTDLAQFRGVEVLNMRFVPTEAVLPSSAAAAPPPPPPPQQQQQQQPAPQKALPSAPATPHAAGAGAGADDDGPPPLRPRWKRFAPPPNPLEGAHPEQVARMAEEEAARVAARTALAGGGGGGDADEASDAAVLAEMELNLVFPDGRDVAEILRQLSGSAAAAHDADTPAVDGRRLSPTALLALTLYAMDGAEIDALGRVAGAGPSPSEAPRNVALSLTDARWAHTAHLLDSLARSGARERRRTAEQPQQECFATLADPPASAVEAWRRRDGRCVAFSAPFSATTSVAMAEEALEQVVHSLVLFRMRTAVGVELGRFSRLPHEEEALVPAHTVLRVTGTSDEDIEGAALTVVYLEEVAESELLPLARQPSQQRASVAPSAGGVVVEATSAATVSRLGSSSLRLGSASAAKSSRRDGGASTASPSPQQPASAGRRSRSRSAAAEAGAASADAAVPDPAYEVEAPHKRRVEGTYVLAEGQTQEGLPVWRTEAVQEAEARWAAYELSSTGGRWSIGKVVLRLSRRRGLVRAEPSSGDGRGAKIAAAKKTRTRDGREVPPDMVGAAGGWLAATRQQTWEYDHSVVVRAVSVTSPVVLPQQQQQQQQPQPAVSEQPQRQQRFSVSRDRQATHRDAVTAAMDSDTSDATSATTAKTTASQSSLPRENANTHPLLLAATFKRGSKKKKKAKAKASSPPRQSQGVQPSWHASFGMPQAKPSSYPAPKRASAGSKPPSFYQPQLSLQGSPGQHVAASTRAAPRLATNAGGVLGGRGRSFAHPQTPVRYAAPPLAQSVPPPAANSFAPPYDGESQCAQYSFWQ